MRILLADDHELILHGLKSMMQRLGPVCEVVTANNLQDAITIAAEGGEFSVVLLDLNMPGMNGVETVQEAVSSFPGKNVAVISGMATKSVAMAVLAAGAKGFIPKTLEGPRLVEALQVLAAGETYVPTELMSGPKRGQPGAMLGYEPLSAREREVAAWLVKGSSNKEIARVLDLREVTIKLHVRNICRKLKTKNRTQIAVHLMHYNQFAG